MFAGVILILFCCFIEMPKWLMILGIIFGALSILENFPIKMKITKNY